MKIQFPGFLIVAILGTASRIGAIVSPLLVNRKKVERFKDIRYGSGESQRLDVYRPRTFMAEQSLPVSLFLHGGGFRFFSKETHAAAAARLAESGRIVVCIDYRLTPKHPFPAGLTDAALAYYWLTENAARFGGDLSRISMIGESSGAGFAVSLSLFLFGLRNFPASVVLPPIPLPKPKAAIIHCGFLETSNVDRFAEDARCGPIARSRAAQVRRNYLPHFSEEGRADWSLADPLSVIQEMAESGTPLPKGFPELFVPVGEKDPVIGDSENLAKAIAELGQTDRLRVYPGVGHAFYASPRGIQADRCWTDLIAFLDRSGA